jgi:hypothetical protein
MRRATAARLVKEIAAADDYLGILTVGVCQLDPQYLYPDERPENAYGVTIFDGDGYLEYYTPAEVREALPDYRH